MKGKSDDSHMTTVAHRLCYCLPGSQLCFIPYCVTSDGQNSTIGIQIEKKNITRNIHQTCCLLFWNCKQMMSKFYCKLDPKKLLLNGTRLVVNPLKPELNSICYLLALLAHHFLHVSRISVKSLTFRRLMSYIYIWSTHS